MKDEQKIVLDYIEKEPFENIIEISQKKFKVIAFRQLDNREYEIQDKITD